MILIESFEGLRKFNEIVCNTPCTCQRVYSVWEEAGGSLKEDYGYHYEDCERSKIVNSLGGENVVDEGRQ